ncbi:Pycsar system effector family protein [Actinoplanes sp. NPDC051494]|uniref:Pycsar system effector family protein n=1 Tax=Actinoplanes sp. NPDC051494 TaxID=3363907 RepID=UPI00378E3465
MIASPRRGPRTTDRPEVPQEQLRLNLDLAWRRHTAQENWIARVDTKASILLTVNGAVLGTVLTARAQSSGFVADLTGWRAVVLWTAMILCGLAEVAAGAVIVPLLGHGRTPDRAGTIFFGDLRRRDPAALGAYLMGLTPEEQFDQLAHQLVVMARASWFKHRVMQALTGTAFTAYLLIFVALAS